MITTNALTRAKKAGKKLVMLTAYDAPTAELVEEAGVDFILVGDSLGMVVLGYESTAPVTMDEMIHHAKAVRRGAKKSVVIGDLPLKGVEKGPRQALESARRFMEEAGCNGVKLEWGPHAAKSIDLLREHGIPVMAHLGLTPQTATDYKARGKTASDAFQLYQRALAVEKQGVFSILLECVPYRLAQELTKALKVPTIGIGAGPYCDGQVLVIQDMLGIYRRLAPRHIKRYAHLDVAIKKAVLHYASEVRTGKFPKISQGFEINETEWAEFQKQRGVRDGS